MPMTLPAAGADASNNEANEMLKLQVSKMGEQLHALQNALADPAEEAVENGACWFDTASERASRATDALKGSVRTGRADGSLR
jgi:hypothetical protein